MENTELKDLIQKSIDGKLNEDEATRLYNWIQESEVNRKLYVKLRDLATLQDIAERENNVLREQGVVYGKEE
ncbi:hypothetical protein SAMN05660841_04361 [Sphingobacterium nematocida]|uniref:Uncharacterized protein n=1 Tax=Sphingobacterium nematocida TaxID=1513896 RepID=A0A1T5GU91_9SPHI|nr:hypothetical protein [Sphingobacterium nematocida]SKC11977.1 hypothetical protein SAMN05660841_04361 [Sphingobacterium nematocida]